MTDQELEGGCQCEAIRYKTSGRPLTTTICHCAMCRRANAAPVVAWAMFEKSQVVFTKRSPTFYASSAEAKRGFCSRCGTQISFTAEYIPGLIDIAIGSLDNPGVVAPMLHYWDSQRLPWVRFADDLPSYPEFPPLE